MLGLQFPCGKQLEQFALSFFGKIKCKPTIKGCDCCLSGVQNICEKMYKDGTPKEEIAAYVLKYIEETLYSMTLNIFKEYGEMPVLFAGGVMSGNIKLGFFSEIERAGFLPALSYHQAGN